MWHTLDVLKKTFETAEYVERRFLHLFLELV